MAEALAQLVAQDVLPLVPELLKEEKPIPIWALKVVEECMESLPEATIPALARWASWFCCSAMMASTENVGTKMLHLGCMVRWTFALLLTGETGCNVTQTVWSNPNTVNVHRLGMTTRFFNYLALESEHNNVRNMRICHLLLEHDAVSPEQLNQAGAYSHVSLSPLFFIHLVEAFSGQGTSQCDRPAVGGSAQGCHALHAPAQVADVLQYAAEKAIESFLPVVLELLASLLEADRKALVNKQPGVPCCYALQRWY